MVFALLSFTNPFASNVLGTYGVCDDDPSRIELKLKADQSFSFQDFSNSANKISVEGKWEMVKGRVILENSSPEISFHSKWKILENGQLAKSRKGMTFYTLAKK